MKNIALTAALALLPTLSLAQTPDLACETIGTLIGAPVPALVFMDTPDFPATWQSGPDEERLVCTWYSEPNARIYAGGELAEGDFEDMALLVAQVVIYDQPLPLADASRMNMAFPVGEEEQWLFGLRAPEGGAPLSPMPLELRDDGPIGVSVAGGPTLGESARSLAGLNQNWGIEAAGRILAHVKPLYQP